MRRYQPLGCVGSLGFWGVGHNLLPNVLYRDTGQAPRQVKHDDRQGPSNDAQQNRHRCPERLVLDL